MASRFYGPARAWVLFPFGVTAALLVRCSGTEADNPVADAVVTACKSEEDYDAGQLEDFLNGAHEAQTAAASGLISKGTEPPAIPRAARKALTRTSDIPLGLSCVEWQLTDNVLDVQVVNFRGGCSVEWKAQTKRSGDRVTVFLENPRCATAACGNCLYDTATSLELPSISDIQFATLDDQDCDGRFEGEEWTLPLTEQPNSMICGYAWMLGLGYNAGQAFSPCANSDALAQGIPPCETGYDCVDAGDGSSHCLPPCTTDADCPLQGGTHCDAGHCAPTEARNYF